MIQTLPLAIRSKWWAAQLYPPKSRKALWCDTYRTFWITWSCTHKSHHQVIKCDDYAVPAPQCNRNYESIFHSRQVSRSVDMLGLLATWQLQNLGTETASKLERSKTKHPTHHWTPDIKDRSMIIGIVVGELKHLDACVFLYIKVHACLFLSHDLCREQTQIRSLKLVVLTQIKLVHPWRMFQEKLGLA